MLASHSRIAHRCDINKDMVVAPDRTERAAQLPAWAGVSHQPDVFAEFPRFCNARYWSSVSVSMPMSAAISTALCLTMFFFASCPCRSKQVLVATFALYEQSKRCIHPSEGHARITSGSPAPVLSTYRVTTAFPGSAPSSLLDICRPPLVALKCCAPKTGSSRVEQSFMLLG